MKLWVKLLLVFLLVALASPFSTFVRSGCCSSHGGVCCECGSQSNGKVICNDGWTGSSCYYSEMVMCGGSSSYIAPTDPPPINTPTPISVPTLIPTKIPTNTPKPVTSTLVPTLTPTKTPTNVPTLTPTLAFPTTNTIPTESLTPSNTSTPTSIIMATVSPTLSPTDLPQVMGTSDTNQESKTNNGDGSTIGGFLLAGIGYGVYKLIKKFKKTKENTG